MAWLGRLDPLAPPPKFWEITVYAGEAANSPAWTVDGSPAR